MSDVMVLGELGSERAEIDAVVEGKTIVDLLQRNATVHGDLPAIHWKEGEEWRFLTWADYRKVALEAAAGLTTLGVERGDVVAIQAGNRPEHVIADFGAIHAGGAGVTLYGTLAPSQIAYIAHDCRAKVAVLEDPSYLRRWESVRKDLPNLHSVVLMTGAEDYAGSDWVVSWGDLLARGRAALEANPDLLEPRLRGMSPTDVATFIYTSGTTGFPKGVVFTHRNLLWTTESARRSLDLPANLREVSYLPLAHIAERMATHYLGLWMASQVWYCPDLGQVLDYINRARPQAFLGVPRVWEKFQIRLLNRFAEDPRHNLITRAVENGQRLVKARQDGRAPFFASLLNLVFDRLIFRKVRNTLGMDQLTVAITTAAPIDPEVIVFFNALGIPLCELFGMSECSGPATTNRPAANRIGTVGTPCPGVEIRVAEDGEVLIRGGNVVAGYFQLPAETAESFDAEGWLHSGDLGSVDADGFLSIIGRKKDLIVSSGGKKIAPSHLETALKSHPLVAHACVVGEARPYLTAIIALDSENASEWANKHGLAFDDMQSFSRLPEVLAVIQGAVDEMNSQLSRVEQIKKFVIVPHDWTPESGEVTPSLKVRRSVVIDKYAGVIEELYRA
jgi:long-chain acyl-CoA synthetase